jgi:predicted kinase
MEARTLVVLRGPSGSGKSTVARRLFDAATRPTALVEQDHYRFMFTPREGEAHSRTMREMIQQNVLTALDNGYDVILEGILTVKHYRPVFEALLRHHPDNNHFFYFDVSLEETLRRHRSRQSANLFTAADMRSWYRAGDVLGHASERVIREQCTLAEAIELIHRARGA